MKINVGRGVIGRTVSATVVPSESRVKTLGSQYYPEPSPEALVRAIKNSARPTSGRPSFLWTGLGVQLLKLDKTEQEILPIVCELHPGYQEISRQLDRADLTPKMREQLQERQGKIQEAIWKNILAA